MTEQDNEKGQYGIFNIMSLGFINELLNEVETNAVLASLLDQEEDGLNNIERQARLEYAVCRLLAGEREMITKAIPFLCDLEIPVCTASCEFLFHYGINPVGASALAYARGIMDAQSNMLSTAFKIPNQTGNDQWVLVNYINYNGEKRIGMLIDLTHKVQWGDTRPRIIFGKNVEFPEVLLSGIVGKSVSHIAHTDVLEDYIVEDVQGKNTFLLKTDAPMKTISWMIEQNYPEFAWFLTVKNEMKMLSMLISSEFNIDAAIERLKTLK